MFPALMAGTSARVRRAAVGVFMGVRDALVERVLLEALRDDDEQVRELAYAGLQRQGEHVLPRLVDYVDALGGFAGAIARLGPFWTGSHGTVGGYDWSADDQRLAIGERQGRLTVWRWRTGRFLGRIPTVDDFQHGVRWGRRGSVGALWTTLSKALQEQWQRLPMDMSDLDVAPNERRVAVATTGGQVLIISDEGAVHLVRSPGSWTRVSWSPCGGYILVSGRNSVAVVSLRDGHSVWELRNEEGSGFDDNCAFCPDGERVVYSCQPTIVVAHAWTGATLREFRDDRFWPSHPVWSPSGRYLAVADSMSNVWVLDTLPRAQHADPGDAGNMLSVSLWEGLGSNDAARAMRAEDRIAAAGRRGVEYLKKWLCPVTATGSQVSGRNRVDVRTVRVLSLLVRLEERGGRDFLRDLAKGTPDAPQTLAARAFLRACN